jgi:RNA 2',3'-cyclic 3'-phosphodiesterase
LKPAAEKLERLFIGVPLSDDVRREIGKSLPKILPGKVVPIENWHFTLRFLGATTADARDQIIQRLKFAGCGATFSIRFSELGAFPSAGRARILWLGIDEGVERMKQLAALAEASARGSGFAAETREFTPHLTLSRIDPPTQVKTLLASKVRLGQRMTVDSVILYRSRLGGGPARYEEVARFPLMETTGRST